MISSAFLCVFIRSSFSLCSKRSFFWFSLCFCFCLKNRYSLSTSVFCFCIQKTFFAVHFCLLFFSCVSLLLLVFGFGNILALRRTACAKQQTYDCRKKPIRLKRIQLIFIAIFCSLSFTGFRCIFCSFVCCVPLFNIVVWVRRSENISFLQTSEK